jgi:MHS family proline/betaine transporter-like MFS transporter
MLTLLSHVHCCCSFGHLGDTKGRRICLLVSVTMMAIPTVLIGCLPTFAQAGLAAPILLALLRAVQGLAMGGEGVNVKLPETNS